MQRHAYALLIGHGRSPRDTAPVDPMAYWFSAQTDASPDYRLACAAFAYLREDGLEDELFARIFWQTVRGRVALLIGISGNDQWSPDYNGSSALMDD